jgi:hypothetical protein
MHPLTYCSYAPKPTSPKVLGCGNTGCANEKVRSAVGYSPSGIDQLDKT